MKDIILTTINAKWIHPSLALRLLKANLGKLEDRCVIMEFALRQPLSEKLDPLLAAFLPSENMPHNEKTSQSAENVGRQILGISVSIWNHLAVIELLGELEKEWDKIMSLRQDWLKPVVVLGGPEVSYLPEEAEIFRYADYVIRGEGEIAFRTLCESILEPASPQEEAPVEKTPVLTRRPQFITAKNVNISELKSGYHLYTDEDISKKLIYVEASRGCPFKCEFCLSAVKNNLPVQQPVLLPDCADNKTYQKSHNDKEQLVREFPIENFLSEMDVLVERSVKTFKFLDRSFNVNIKRAKQIMEFLLAKINENEKKQTENQKTKENRKFVVHFEMVPSLFPQELLETLSRFPTGTLRLEIGIQTLNPKIDELINRQSDPEKELAAIRLLREKTNAIIHADLIAGLPGEDLTSFGRGFDRLWLALSDKLNLPEEPAHENSIASQFMQRTEIQIGILKLLPGAPISHRSETWQMRYNSIPPYEVIETSAISANGIEQIKNFARFWEIIVNRNLSQNYTEKIKNQPVFDHFSALSNNLYEHFGKNWGIAKGNMLNYVENIMNSEEFR